MKNVFEEKLYKLSKVTIPILIIIAAGYTSIKYLMKKRKNFKKSSWTTSRIKSWRIHLHPSKFKAGTKFSYSLDIWDLSTSYKMQRIGEDHGIVVTIIIEYIS